MRVLFSFIGSHDPVTGSIPSGQSLDGPVLSLVKHHTFDRIVLLAATAMLTSAEETAALLRERHPDSEVILFPCAITDPTSHIEVLHWQRQALKKFTGNSRECFAALASGTPQMHACWLLLAGAGEFTLKLLQLRNPRFVSVAQSPVTVVDPMHPELPRVLADLDQWTNSDDTPLDLQASCHAAGIAGTHPALMKPLRKAVRAAPTDIGILILGESGTGKELAAKLIHQCSGRTGHFIPVNCGGLPEHLAESEFFGHKKGAFTGADKDREGLFKQAEGGTIFLDEIGEMPPALQVKLLRTLNDKKVRPLGSEKEITVNVRIVAATNADIEAAIQEKTFREDLYYRIAGMTLELPPLRHRITDIPELLSALMENSNLLRKKRITGKALQKLQSHSWPGNIRELAQVLQNTLIMTEGDVMDADDIEFRKTTPTGISFDHLPEPREGFDIKKYCSEINRHLKLHALEITGNNTTRAAKLLGISPAALSKELKKKGPTLRKESINNNPG